MNSTEYSVVKGRLEEHFRCKVANDFTWAIFGNCASLALFTGDLLDDVPRDLRRIVEKRLLHGKGTYSSIVLTGRETLEQECKSFLKNNEDFSARMHSGYTELATPCAGIVYRQAMEEMERVSCGFEFRH